MSDHDPFDGLYDSAPPAAAVATERVVGKSEHESAENQPTQSADQTESSRESAENAPKPRHLSKTEITRMDKAELRDAARERGLDASGSRVELQAALRDYQGE